MIKDNIKKENGITIVILIVTIVVILILATGTVFLGKDLVTNANIENIATNLLLIQVKVKTISEKIDFDQGATDLLKGREIIITQQKDKDIVDKLSITDINSMKRILTKQDLENWGLQNIAAENEYLVDYKTCEVYYIPGVKDKNNNILYDATTITNKSKEIGK